MRAPPPSSLALLLALCSGPASAAPDAPPLVPIQVIAVPEAAGPPAQPNCAEALERAVALKAARGPVESESPRERPPAAAASLPGPIPPPADPPAALQNPPVTRADLARLPGRDPAALPLQPLGGSPQAIAAAGDVVRLMAAGQPVRLSFFGASHMGGDYFTGHLRRLYQAELGDRGHGFLWPAALYAHHRASDINLCRTEGWRADWEGKGDSRADGLNGFSGATVSSSDPHDFGWLETTRDNAQGRSIARLDIFALGQPGGGSLMVQVDEAASRVLSTAAETPTMLHFRVKVPDGPHRFQLQPLGDGEVRLMGVSAERGDAGVLVDSIGIRGRMARTWLSRDADLVVQGVQALAPDLLVLAYGTNEAADTSYSMARYREDLVEVVRLARRGAPGAACVLLGPSDRGVERQKGQRWAIWARTAPVAQVQREVALAEGCSFWDWQQATGGPGSMISWRMVTPPLAAWDLIHFSQAGYERLAEAFDQALRDAAARSGGTHF